MIIRKKIHIKYFLVNFSGIAEWDGNKYFIVVEDPTASGTITFMQYPDGSCTYYRQNESFCDVREIPLENDFVWNYRKLLNRKLKELTT